MRGLLTDVICILPGFSETVSWAFICFLDGNENKVDISTVGTNGNFFLINAHGVLRRMGAVTEISGTHDNATTNQIIKGFIYYVTGANRKTALRYIGPQLSYV